MLATTTTIPLNPDWAYEVKWDGMRLLADAAEAGIRLHSRSTADVTASFPEIVAALRTIEVDVMLDGELIALDDSGLPSFAALASRMHVQNPRRALDLSRSTPLTYMVFDVLRWRGRSTLDLPFTQRSELLSELRLPQGLTRSAVFDDGELLLQATREQGLEGVIAKRRSSPYRPGVRSADWIKHAHRATTSVIIAGWRRGEGRAANRVGSLITAVPAGNGLEYRGTAGSGINDETAATLGAVLADLELDSPAINIPEVDLKTLQREGYRWCDPLIVMDVAHLGHTASGKLRQPVVVRLRTDLGPADLQSTAQPDDPPDNADSGRAGGVER